MDLPTLLVRETVQNSWDAAQHPGLQPVTFRIDGWTLKGSVLDAFRTVVFRDRSVPGLPLESVLEQDEVPVLVISDRGTTGLGGATRADIVTSESSDFADFVRNVGQPPDKEQGGGTYGYGKAVLFLASRASTVIAYTRCITLGRSESRLIAIGLGEPFSIPEQNIERLYTGRHWWGRCDADAGIEPLTGDSADRVAQLIGIPGFEDDSHGTSIMIVGAEFGGLSLDAAVLEMKEAILWHCWPKMIANGAGAPPIRFFLSVEGNDVPLGSPSEHPELRGFVEAYRAASRIETRRVLLATSEEIRCQNPRRSLGQLGIVQFVRDKTLLDSVPGRPFTGPPHHVALMRSPRLVVTYLPGPETPVPGIAWAGAFIADASVDRAFAAAEPPTHDDWTPDILPRSHEKTFVNVGLRNIKEAVKLFARPAPPPTDESDLAPLAGIAAALGGLLAGVSGPGTRIPPAEAPGRTGKTRGRTHSAASGSSLGGQGAEFGGTTPQRGGRSSPRVEVLDYELTLDEIGPAMDVSFRLLPGSSPQTVVRADPAVAVNDGSSLEREEPFGAARPKVVHWRVGEQVIPYERLLINGSEAVEGCVRVTIPPDTSVAVTVSAEPFAEETL